MDEVKTKDDHLFSREELEKHSIDPIALNGKILRIQVCKDNITCESDKQALSFYSVFGQDIKTDEVFLLFEQLDKGES